MDVLRRSRAQEDPHVGTACRGKLGGMCSANVLRLVPTTILERATVIAVAENGWPGVLWANVSGEWKFFVE